MLTASGWKGPAVAAAVMLAPLPFRSPDEPKRAEPPPSVTPAFRLVERSRQAGLVFTHEPTKVHPSIANIEALLSVTGANLTVFDHDGDGFMDVLTAGSAKGSRAALFRNRGDGTFEDVGPRAGLDVLTRDHGVVRVLAFEADGDGRPDLLVCDNWLVRLFLNKGGRFEEAGQTGFPAGQSYATAALDIDGDGRLDLAIGYQQSYPEDILNPRRFDFVKLGNAPSWKDPARIMLFRNLGGGRFESWPGQPVVLEPGLPQAFGVYDFLGNGRPSLYGAFDYSPDHLLLNYDGKKLVDASSRVSHVYSLSGMNAEVADLDGDGKPVMMVSQVYSPGHAVFGNVLWKIGPGARFEDQAARRGVARCGWSWGGRFMDLDGDGRLDLVVANGMLSGPRDRPARNYWFRRNTLRQAALEVQSDARSWPRFGGSSMSGRQRDCVFLNTERGFVDVAGALGFDRERLDGRGVADLDPRNDGTLAILVANRAGPLRYYLDEPAARRRWVGLTLAGPPANPDAWGARVTLRLDDGRTLSEEVEPANGYASQKDPRPRFSLGPKAKVVSASIRWPGGRVSETGPLAEGRYRRVSAADAR
jgi:enediyne biosynthesis protein E4